MQFFLGRLSWTDGELGPAGVLRGGGGVRRCIVCLHSCAPVGVGPAELATTIGLMPVGQRRADLGHWRVRIEGRNGFWSAQSMMSLRMKRMDASRMLAISSGVVDDQGTHLVDRWHLETA